MRKVLFTSPVQPIGGCSPDVYSWNKSTTAVKLMMSFLNHPGLSFLRANVPGIDVLEYPTWESFRTALKERVDVLGISFYINETELAVQMAEYARQQGVREVWAGNYGAYSPQVNRYFDRVITGWGEAPVAIALDQEPTKPDQFEHPVMYGSLGTNLAPVMSLHGFLYTSRGCPYTCNFCQTPDFYGKASVVPLESIERVLWTYAKQGIVTVNILDENFGIFAKHSQEVIRLMKKYKLRWIPLARADLMLRHFEEWKDHGLFGAHLGIESLNSSSLKGADKRLDILKSVSLLKLMSRNNMIVQAFYILGFEEDTEESIQRDIEELAGLDVDIPQIQVLTPYPRTKLRGLIDREYGILDHNLSRYNSRNLVWKHPNIHQEKMKELQLWANNKLFTASRALRTLSKVLLHDCSGRWTSKGMMRIAKGSIAGVLQGVSQANRAGIRATRAWGLRGWDAYEEVSTHRVKSRLPLASESG